MKKTKMKGKNKMNKKTESMERLLLNVKARRLLRSGKFFQSFLNAVRTAGLVGEEQNALAAYLVGISRLLAHPVNLFVKGVSSSGKNYLVKSVLRFFPKECVVEITSSSVASWNYLGNNLQHRIVYIQEQNKAAGNVHPARLLISENELVRLVSVRSGSGFETQRQVTKGPVSCISTTTRNRLEVDDETRHVSIWMDDSSEQTTKILAAQLGGTNQMDAEELAVWHEVQSLLEERAKLPIDFEDWAQRLVTEIWTGDVRVRRYFEAFRETCKVVCLVRSFRFDEEEIAVRGRLQVGFTDYAVASLIFSSAFSKSLSYGDEEDSELITALSTISARKKGGGADASELAKELGISRDRAYAKLQEALKRGSIRRSNETTLRNLKLYLPAARTGMLPDPRTVFQKLFPRRRVTFVHPITGRTVEYGHTGKNMEAAE